MRCGTPAARWRTTIASMPIASMVCTVSRRLSPFVDRRAGHGERHRVGGEALRCGLEREPGAGRVLVEERHDGLAAQRGDLRDVAVGDLEERLAQVEELLEVVAGEVVDRQQMAHQPLLLGHRPGRPVPTARSRPRRRRPRPRRTRTSSARLVGRFFPTKSARIGSSRWPRSTRTASLHRAGPAQLGERVERGADGAAGEEDVVDEDDRAAGDVDRDLGRAERL